ncbi:MAG: PPOX class F420-dependent oxidoreductase [Acidimicrobiia bacterium]|nr:PPOX class F420-dependent oxidoreductase [Acidimicrobiia bacterium]
MARSVATNRYVDRDEMLEFVRPRHNGILTTVRADGRTQQSPVTMGLDDDDRVVIASYPERAKVFNARRNLEASVLVLSDDFGGEWQQLYGRVEILDLPDALEPLVEYFRNIAGEHSDWDEYREAMVKQGKVLIRVTIDDWGPIAKGGFPARLVDG